MGGEGAKGRWVARGQRAGGWGGSEGQVGGEGVKGRWVGRG